jgi:hypothetical protein
VNILDALLLAVQIAAALCLWQALTILALRPLFVWWGRA